MTTYATVGVQRIQTYLARSRHLWGRRGASEELVQLTALPQSNSDSTADTELTVSKVLNDPAFQCVQINPEGLDVDGVISLRSKETAADQGEQQVKGAAIVLAHAIRERLPGITVEVRHITGDDNYAKLTQAHDEWRSQTWFPLANEFPAVRPCDECGLDPASITKDDHDGKKLRLCNDCSTRHAGAAPWRQSNEAEAKKKKPGSDRHAGAARWRQSSLTQQIQQTSRPNRFTAEGWLLRELHTTDYPDLKFSKDFEELGKIGPSADSQNFENLLRSRTHEGNHTALIFADGNGMGALFKSLLEEAADTADDDSTWRVREISKKIKDATSNALLEATKAILTEQDEICPVVPHINGGDDVLVSVTAPRAWRFLTKFLAGLKRCFDELSGECGHQVSMSAGMVFCKAEYPLANQVELAEILMRRAKTAVCGQGWSFAWLDITHDGLETEAHEPWLLDKLTTHTEALEHLRGVMTAHGEAALLNALADANSRGVLLSHLASRISDVNEFLKLLGINEPARITDEQVRLIQNLTSIGRWWR